MAAWTQLPRSPVGSGWDAGSNSALSASMSLFWRSTTDRERQDRIQLHDPGRNRWCASQSDTDQPFRCACNERGANGASCLCRQRGRTASPLGMWADRTCARCQCRSTWSVGHGLNADSDVEETCSMSAVLQLDVELPGATSVDLPARDCFGPEPPLELALPFGRSREWSHGYASSEPVRLDQTKPGRSRRA